MRYRAKFLGIPLIVVGALAVLTWVVMTLWNGVIPGLFSGAHAIDYWHAMGLLVLSRILFGGFRGRGGFPGGRRWQRFEAMTAEERARFGHRGRCGSGSSSQETL